MPPTLRAKDGLLARVNFPLYSVQMLTSRHVLVAGGGGSAKTGVANGFEIFEISHDGRHFVAEEITRHETGRTVIMNCASHTQNQNMYLVAGQDNHSQLYHVKQSITEDSTEDEPAQNNVRQRSVTNNQNNTGKHSKTTERRLKFDIRAADSIQTDFSKEEPLQKVVRISFSGSLMATGGSDGHVRLWKFPHLKKILEISGHSKEVDDVDFNRKESQVVSLSKDGTAVIWGVATGKKVHELTWPVPEGSKYLYKRCRYGAVEEDKDKSRLFTLTNPVGRPGRLKSYLQLWDPAEGRIRRIHPYDESLASLAVRDDGRFVAVGTMFSGSVHIHVAFSLQRVLNVGGAHNMFVTGLEFLPVSSVTSAAEAAVISISVDNRVCIHTLYHRRSIPTWLAIVLIIATLFGTFVLCSYLGL